MPHSHQHFVLHPCVVERRINEPWNKNIESSYWRFWSQWSQTLHYFTLCFLLSLCAWFSQMRIRSRRWSTRGLREQPSLWWWQRKAPGSTSTIWLVRRRARRTSTPAEVRWGESKTVTWPWTTRPQIKDNLLHHTHAHLHLSWNSCRLIPLRYLPSLTYSLLSPYSSFRQERGC